MPAEGGVRQAEIGLFEALIGALTAGPDNADGFASAQPQYVVPEHIVLAEFVAFTLAVVKNANDGNMRLEILNRAGQLRSVCPAPVNAAGSNTTDVSFDFGGDSQVSPSTTRQAHQVSHPRMILIGGDRIRFRVRSSVTSLGDVYGPSLITLNTLAVKGEFGGIVGL